MKPAFFKSLFETRSLPSLGPDRRLDALSAQSIEARIVEARSDLPADKILLVKALALLWHDHLDAAHNIVQDIANQDGSFLHGVMHRREPDYGNAKYWFRRTGMHPCFNRLAKSVQSYLSSSGASKLTPMLLSTGTWNPLGFVNACERASGAGAHVSALQEIQRLEFQAFFEELTGCDIA